MPNATTIPRSDAGKRALLQHLSNHLTNYVTILEITPADLTQVKIGFDWFDYSLKLEDAAQNYTDAFFAFKRVLRDGPKSTVLNPPVALVLVTAPASVPYADIFGFLGALIVRIKKHKNYTEAIGKALHIIAPQSPAQDTATLQPILTYDFKGNHPTLYWKHNGTKALELEADHGTGTFSLQTIKISPSFEDTTPLPLPGTIALWRYRAIYHIHDEQVGQWSPILEIMVKGE